MQVAHGLLRVTRLIATTCDEDWPTTLSATTVASLNSWGHHPTTDPGVLLQILTFLTALTRTTRERYWVSERWNRYLRQEPRAIAATVLPKRPGPPKQHRIVAAQFLCPLLTSMNRIRTHALARAVAAAGVLPDHIRAVVPTVAGAFLPPQELWPVAQELTVARSTTRSAPRKIC